MKWKVVVIEDRNGVWFHCHREGAWIATQYHDQRIIDIEADAYWEAQRKARQVIDVERRLAAAAGAP